MTFETVEQYLNRGGKITKVNWDDAYRKIMGYRMSFIDYAKKQRLKEKAEKRENETKRTD